MALSDAARSATPVDGTRPAAGQDRCLAGPAARCGFAQRASVVTSLSKWFSARTVSENIGYQFSSAGFGSIELARGFVQDWIESPGHRRNLLAPEATDIGVAIARSARSGRYYAVQMFGRPATLRVRFALSNRNSSALRYAVDGRSNTLIRGETRWHELCRPPTVKLNLPGKDTPIALQPADGAHYRIEAVGPGLHLIGR
jgi:Cysteine-rich secretory protein family